MQIGKVFSQEKIIEILMKEYRDKVSREKSGEYFHGLGDFEQTPKMTADDYRYVFEQNFMHENRDRNGNPLEFKYTDAHKFVVDALCWYFARDERFLQLNSNYSFEKGIALVGSVGVGKTSVLKAFRFNPVKSFGVVDCKEVVKAFSEKDRDRFTFYTNPNRNISRSQNYGQECFGWMYDDLGIENEGQHFGNKLNVMADVIERIYNHPDMVGRCHITTNLKGEQIEEMYGERVRSRMRSIFNPIQFPSTAKDMRQ